MIVAGCLMATPAIASEDLNADEWAENCASQDSLEQGMCAGAVANTVDVIQGARKVAPTHALVCWDQSWFQRLASADNNAQIQGYLILAKIGVEYLRAHPGFAKEPMPVLLIAAFMRKWPCGGVGPTR
jgi:hypothetical protein